MAEACPRDELLGAYIEHNLLPEQQQQLEAHLLECRLCRERIARVIATMATVPDPRSTSGDS